ncbi:MAG: DUF4870 domain-containing protein [Terriglobales bacterium]
MQENEIAAPSADEKTMATLAHVLQLVGSFIAPLVILLIKRDSRFVSFHALQALLLQVVYMICWGLMMSVFFVSFFFLMSKEQSGKERRPEVQSQRDAAPDDQTPKKETSPGQEQTSEAGKDEKTSPAGQPSGSAEPAGRKTDVPPAFIFLLFPFIWLGSMGAWLVMLIVVIVYAIKAGRGEWASYPILGGWAKKLLGVTE